jgi:hypothetical protein
LENNMKSLFPIAALAFVFAMALPLTAQAQSDPAFKVGPRVTLSVGDISDAFGGDLAIGADLRYQFAEFPIQGTGAFDFYFADEDITVFTIDVNVVYPLEVGETFAPYVGAGLGYTNVSVDIDTQFGSFSGDTSDTGLNLVGGTEFLTGAAFTPFAQAQLTVGDVDRFAFTGGLLFTL